jgi:hypothetical protein
MLDQDPYSKMNTDPKPWRKHLLFILECSVLLDPMGPQLLKAVQLRPARDTRVAAAEASCLTVPPHVVLAHKADAAAAATEGRSCCHPDPQEKAHFILNQGLRIRVTLMRIRIQIFTLIRIRIQLFTLMRIRILLFTLMRLRIQLFTLMRIRIQLLSKVMGICDH